MSDNSNTIANSDSDENLPLLTYYGPQKSKVIDKSTIKLREKKKKKERIRKAKNANLVQKELLHEKTTNKVTPSLPLLSPETETFNKINIPNHPKDFISNFNQNNCLHQLPKYRTAKLRKKYLGKYISFVNLGERIDLTKFKRKRGKRRVQHHIYIIPNYFTARYRPKRKIKTQPLSKVKFKGINTDKYLKKLNKLNSNSSVTVSVDNQEKDNNNIDKEIKIKEEVQDSQVNVPDNNGEEDNLLLFGMQRGERDEKLKALKKIRPVPKSLKLNPRKDKPMALIRSCLRRAQKMAKRVGEPLPFDKPYSESDFLIKKEEEEPEEEKNIEESQSQSNNNNKATNETKSSDSSNSNNINFNKEEKKSSSSHSHNFLNVNNVPDLIMNDMDLELANLDVDIPVDTDELEFQPDDMKSFLEEIAGPGSLKMSNNTDIKSFLDDIAGPGHKLPLPPHPDFIREIYIFEQSNPSPEALKKLEKVFDNPPPLPPGVFFMANNKKNESEEEDKNSDEDEDVEDQNNVEETVNNTEEKDNDVEESVSGSNENDTNIEDLNTSSDTLDIKPIISPEVSPDYFKLPKGLKSDGLTGDYWRSMSPVRKRGSIKLVREKSVSRERDPEAEGKNERKRGRPPGKVNKGRGRGRKKINSDEQEPSVDSEPTATVVTADKPNVEVASSLTKRQYLGRLPRTPIKHLPKRPRRRRSHSPDMPDLQGPFCEIIDAKRAFLVAMSIPESEVPNSHKLFMQIHQSKISKEDYKQIEKVLGFDQPDSQISNENFKRKLIKISTDLLSPTHKDKESSTSTKKRRSVSPPQLSPSVSLESGSNLYSISQIQTFQTLKKPQIEASSSSNSSTSPPSDTITQQQQQLIQPKKTTSTTKITPINGKIKKPTTTTEIDSDKFEIKKLDGNRIYYNGSLFYNINHTDYIKEFDVPIEFDPDQEYKEDSPFIPFPKSSEKEKDDSTTTIATSNNTVNTAVNNQNNICSINNNNENSNPASINSNQEEDSEECCKMTEVCKQGCVCKSVSMRNFKREKFCGLYKCIFECICLLQQKGGNQDVVDRDIRSRLRPRVSILNWKAIHKNNGFEDRGQDLNTKDKRLRLKMKIQKEKEARAKRNILPSTRLREYVTNSPNKSYLQTLQDYRIKQNKSSNAGSVMVPVREKPTSAALLAFKRRSLDGNKPIKKIPLDEKRKKELAERQALLYSFSTFANMRKKSELENSEKREPDWDNSPVISNLCKCKPNKVHLGDIEYDEELERYYPVDCKCKLETCKGKMRNRKQVARKSTSGVRKNKIQLLKIDEEFEDFNYLNNQRRTTIQRLKNELYRRKKLPINKESIEAQELQLSDSSYEHSFLVRDGFDKPISYLTWNFFKDCLPEVFQFTFGKEQNKNKHASKVPWLLLPLPELNKEWMLFQIPEEFSSYPHVVLPSIKLILSTSVLKDHFDKANIYKIPISLIIKNLNRMDLGKIYAMPFMPRVLLIGPCVEVIINKNIDDTKENFVSFEHSYTNLYNSHSRAIGDMNFVKIDDILRDEDKEEIPESIVNKINEEFVIKIKQHDNRKRMLQLYAELKAKEDKLRYLKKNMCNLDLDLVENIGKKPLTQPMFTISNITSLAASPTTTINLTSNLLSPPLTTTSYTPPSPPMPTIINTTSLYNYNIKSNQDSRSLSPGPSSFFPPSPSSSPPLPTIINTTSLYNINSIQDSRSLFLAPTSSYAPIPPPSPPIPTIINTKSLYNINSNQDPQPLSPAPIPASYSKLLDDLYGSEDEDEESHEVYDQQFDELDML